jgi:hypothetical protein
MMNPYISMNQHKLFFVLFPHLKLAGRFEFWDESSIDVSEIRLNDAADLTPELMHFLHGLDKYLL